MMEKKLGGGEIRKDGVSVGKEVELRDGLEKRGGEVVKCVGCKRGDDGGEGRSSGSVLGE